MNRIAAKLRNILAALVATFFAMIVAAPASAQSVTAQPNPAVYYDGDWVTEVRFIVTNNDTVDINQPYEAYANTTLVASGTLTIPPNGGTHIIDISQILDSPGSYIRLTSTGAHNIDFAYYYQPLARPDAGIAAAQAHTVNVARISGDAISTAAASAVEEGFSGGDFMSFTGSGVRFNFAADPKKHQRIDDAFAGVKTGRAADYAPPPAEWDWQPWIEVKASGLFDNDTAANFEGDQVNFTSGLTWRASANAVFGLFAGYEDFDYDSAALDANLTGDGWTAGGYLGLKLSERIRFDAALAYSELYYDSSSGAVTAAFSGERWLASAKLSGNYAISGVRLEPSASIYVLWEDQDAYTDSAGADYAAFKFRTGRASAGLKASKAFDFGSGAVTPYAGVYADYYFDDTTAAFFAPLPDGAIVLEDLSARVIGGIGFDWERASLSLGGEVGGLGDDAKIWSAKGRGAIRF